MLKINILKNKIDAINELNSYLNIIIPKIADLLKTGYKTKKDYSFDKKTTDKINNILNQDRPADNKRIRRYIQSTKYSICLHADTNYKTHEFGCNYYKTYIYFSDIETHATEKRKTDYNIKDVNQDRETIEKYNNQIEKFQDIINDIKNNNEIIK